MQLFCRIACIVFGAGGILLSGCDYRTSKSSTISDQHSEQNSQVKSGNFSIFDGLLDQFIKNPAGKNEIISNNQLSQNQRTKDVEAARFWKKQGYDFDPSQMTAAMMDQKVQEDIIGQPSNKSTNQRPISFSTSQSQSSGLGSGYSSQNQSRLSQIDSTGQSQNSTDLSDWYRPNRSVAENGSYYGETSENTGRPKTVYVNGYYRKDGTYVRSHYRSSPRR